MKLFGIVISYIYLLNSNFIYLFICICIAVEPCKLDIELDRFRLQLGVPIGLLYGLGFNNFALSIDFWKLMGTLNLYSQTFMTTLESQQFFKTQNHRSLDNVTLARERKYNFNG